jgi:hypothetical protein
MAGSGAERRGKMFRALCLCIPAQFRRKLENLELDCTIRLPPMSEFPIGYSNQSTAGVRPLLAVSIGIRVNSKA